MKSAGRRKGNTTLLDEWLNQWIDKKSVTIPKKIRPYWICFLDTEFGWRMNLYIGTAIRNVLGVARQVGTEERINSFTDELERQFNQSIERFVAWIKAKMALLPRLETRSRGLMMSMTLYLMLLSVLGLLAEGSSAMAVMAASLCGLWLSLGVENGYRPVSAGIRQRYIVSTLMRAGSIGVLLIHYFGTYLSLGVATNVVLQSAMVITLTVHAAFCLLLVMFNRRQPLLLRAIACVVGVVPALTAAAAAALGAACMFGSWVMMAGGVMSALGAGMVFLGDELIHMKNLGGIRLKYYSIWVCLLMIAGYMLMLCGAWTYTP